MYWTMKGNLIVDKGNQIIDCPNCPCPLYSIAVMCKRDVNGLPDCSCNPLEHYPNVFIGQYIICNEIPFISYKGTSINIFLTEIPIVSV